MLTYLLIAFYTIVAIQCIYYLLFLTPILFNKKRDNILSPPISVIICAKNEAENLEAFLPNIISQKYENEYEVVVINDRSKDRTAEVLEEFSKKHTQIKIVTVENSEHFWGNKKYALTLGIKAAKHEHLLFTDADCTPKNTSWISGMSSCFDEKKSIVLGYGGYRKVRGSFLNKLIRYETVLTAIQYFSYAKIGVPYMGVGRNLAYTKTDFFRVNGFIKHIQVKSGDDDLFINEVATSQNTSINIEEGSFTESIPKNTFKEWIQQKRRHVSTAKYYKTKHKVLLSIFYASQILFFLLGFTLLLTFNQKELILLMILIRYSVVFTTVGLFSNKLKEKDLILILPFTEIILILLQLYIYLKNKSATPVQWH